MDSHNNSKQHPKRRDQFELEMAGGSFWQHKEELRESFAHNNRDSPSYVEVVKQHRVSFQQHNREELPRPATSGSQKSVGGASKVSILKHSDRNNYRQSMIVSDHCVQGNLRNSIGRDPGLTSHSGETSQKRKWVDTKRKNSSHWMQKGNDWQEVKRKKTPSRQRYERRRSLLASGKYVGQGGTEKESEVRCFKCDEVGHTKFECNRDYVCYACKRSGHTATGCQQRDVSKQKELIADRKLT